MRCATAFPCTDPPESIATPVALRAPELIVHSAVDFKIDIWSIGCLLFEFSTGERLFNVASMFMIPQVEQDDEHLLKLVDTLGTLPLALAERWPRYMRYFGQNHERIRTDVGYGPLSDAAPLIFFEDLGTRLDRLKVKEMGGILKKMLAYRKEDRPSAAELLNNSFFLDQE